MYLTELTQEAVISKVQAHQEHLQEFAVQDLFLFGSVARNEATAESDIDFLVNFSRPVGLFTLLKLKAFLEDLLGRDVDIGTPDSLRPHLRETVLNEVIRVV